MRVIRGAQREHMRTTFLRAVPDAEHPARTIAAAHAPTRMPPVVRAASAATVPRGPALATLHAPRADGTETAGLANASENPVVERATGEVPLSWQAALLSLSRSSLYYQPKSPSEREVAIKHRIDELYTAYPFYGSRRIPAVLQPECGSLARNTVRQYMHEMGISAVYPGPNLSRRQHEHRVYPYLLRQRAMTAPNQVWAIDITYVRLRQGWMYLVAIIDWYSRYSISWRSKIPLRLALCLKWLTTRLG